MLGVIRDEILPLAESESAKGNDPSGSAVIRSDTLTSVMVGADNRLKNPVFHGEMDTIIRFFKLPVHPSTDELIFLATHSPCPMCAAAIAWSGFRELWVLFENGNDDPDRPVRTDRAMFRKLFGVDGTRKDNGFFTSNSIKKAIAAHKHRDDLQTLLEEAERRYAALKPHEAAASAQ
jgi:tRNA(Arg) A34 adenosine deaminase TadA